MKTSHIAASLLMLAIATAANADYPIFWQRYTADPSALVYEGRYYLFCSHDTYDKDKGYGYFMNDVTCISTTDMKNWTDHGEVFSYKQSAWGATETWAPQVTEKDGKFYLYYGDADRRIGVAVADNPLGPYVDDSDAPLVSHDTPGVDVFDKDGNRLVPDPATPGALQGAENWGVWVFDPTAFIDPATGNAYLYFGGAHPDYSRIIRLKDNMVETEGRAIHPNTPGFFEGSWAHERNGIYYYSYAGHGFGTPANIEYVMSTNPMWGFQNPGVMLPNPPDNDGMNNHHSVVEYKGNWYLAYHSRKVVHEQLKAAEEGVEWCKEIDGVDDHRAHEYMRSVAVDRLYYNDDGSIKTVEPTEDGLQQLEYVDATQRQEAEMMAKGWGIATAEGATGRIVSSRHEGDYTVVRGVDMGSGLSKITASVGGDAKGTVTVRTDAVDGDIIATIHAPKSSSYKTVKTSLKGNPSGVHDLYFVFSTPSTRIDYWQME